VTAELLALQERQEKSHMQEIWHIYGMGGGPGGAECRCLLQPGVRDLFTTSRSGSRVRMPREIPGREEG
jgi:hypothetical protein